MTTNIEKALKFVLQWEGKFVNDPDDPGGATNFGVTINTLRALGIDIDGDKDIDVDDVRKIRMSNDTPEMDSVVEIYREKYWNALDCDNLAWPIAMAAFDTAVNCGVGRAKRWLKESLAGELDKSVENHLREFLNMRVVHYLKIIRNNPDLAKYKKGWLNRVTDLKKYISITSDETTS